MAKLCPCDVQKGQRRMNIIGLSPSHSSTSSQSLREFVMETAPWNPCFITWPAMTLVQHNICHAQKDMHIEQAVLSHVQSGFIQCAQKIVSRLFLV